MNDKKIKLLFVLLLVFQLVVPAEILAAAVGQFTSIIGDVAQERAGLIIKPVVESPIELKDMIITGDRSAASMIFSDESTINLASDSKFEVKEFYIQDSLRRGSFFLAIGKLTANVMKFIGGDSSFEVQSPTAVAGVRGTGFEIVVAVVEGQMTTTVTCTVGAMSVSAISATGVIVSTTTIVAGQTAVVTSSGITVSAAGAGAAGAGSSTTGAGATGTGTGAAGGGAAGTAGAVGTTGAAAGTAAAAGITAGTVAVGVAAAAAVAATVAESTGDETATTHHTTTQHH